MTNGFHEVIEVRPRAPALFGAVLATGACFSIQSAAIPGGWAVAGLAGVAVVAGIGLWTSLARRRVTRAMLLPDGRWILFLGDSRRVAARLARSWGESLGPVIALQWACADGACRNAWLLAGDLRPPQWRRLRVRLRLS